MKSNNDKDKMFSRIVCISLFFIPLLIAVGCSNDNTTPNTSSSETSVNSSITDGDSASNSLEINQNGSFDIGDTGNGSVSGLEAPVEDMSALIGRWEYIYEDPNGNWVFVIEFSEDGKLVAFPAPQGLGADNWFDGEFTLADGIVSYDGNNEENDFSAPNGILSSPISGTFLASITKDGNLILRGDSEDGLLSSVIARDVEYIKVQDEE